MLKIFHHRGHRVTQGGGGVLVFGCLALVALACTKDPAPKGFYVLRNDIMDKEYNTVVVDQVMAKGALTPFRVSLRPGDSVKVPHRHVTGMRFSRRYKDFTRVYVVKCPEDSEAGVTIKLIDVHMNRLAGGCELIKRGEERSGVVKWEEG